MSVLPRVLSMPDLEQIPAGELRSRTYVRRVWRWFYDATSAIDRPDLIGASWFLSSAQRDELARKADAFVAHSAIETGYGVRLIHWNFGFHVGKGPGGDSFTNADIGVDGKVHDVQFKAFRSRVEGVVAYVAKIAQGPTRWKVAGDNPDHFLVALRESGYLSATDACGPPGDKHTCSDEELVAAMRVRVAFVQKITADLRPSSTKAALASGLALGMVATAGIFAVQKALT